MTARERLAAQIAEEMMTDCVRRDRMHYFVISDRGREPPPFPYGLAGQELLRHHGQHSPRT